MPVKDIDFEVLDSQYITHTGTLQSGLATLANLPMGQGEIIYHGTKDAAEQKTIKCDIPTELNDIA